METIRYELDDAGAGKGIATLTFDAPGSPVNTMTPEWQRDLAEAAARLVADKDRIRGVILASAKSTFFAGAALKSLLTPDRCRRGARVRRHRGDEGELSSHRDARPAGRGAARRLGARRRLGGGADRACAVRARRSEDPLRHARGDARPDPGRDRDHQDGAKARPGRRATLPARGPAVRSARGAAPGLDRGARRQRRRAAAARDRLDRRPPRCGPALGRPRLPHPRRHAGESEDRRRPRRRPGDAAGRRRAASIRRARRSSRRWSRARSSTSTRRCGSRAASSRRSWSGRRRRT